MRTHIHAHIHTHRHSDNTQTQTHTQTLAGTILACEWRSQSHHHSFQEGQPQSHCAGFPTGEGRLEGEDRKEGKERWRKEESACVCLCVCKCLCGARVYTADRNCGLS